MEPSISGPRSLHAFRLVYFDSYRSAYVAREAGLGVTRLSTSALDELQDAEGIDGGKGGERERERGAAAGGGGGASGASGASGGRRRNETDDRAAMRTLEELRFVDGDYLDCVIKLETTTKGPARGPAGVGAGAGTGAGGWGRNAGGPGAGGIGMGFGIRGVAGGMASDRLGANERAGGGGAGAGTATGWGRSRGPRGGVSAASPEHPWGPGGNSMPDARRPPVGREARERREGRDGGRWEHAPPPPGRQSFGAERDRAYPGRRRGREDDDGDADLLPSRRRRSRSPGR